MDAGVESGRPVRVEIAMGVADGEPLTVSRRFSRCSTRRGWRFRPNRALTGHPLAGPARRAPGATAGLSSRARLATETNARQPHGAFSHPHPAACAATLSRFGGRGEVHDSIRPRQQPERGDTCVAPTGSRQDLLRALAARWCVPLLSQIPTDTRPAVRHSGGGSPLRRPAVRGCALQPPRPALPRARRPRRRSSGTVPCRPGPWPRAA